MVEPLEVVMLSGSLRAASYNTKLLDHLASVAPPSLRLARHSFADFPVFNYDLEQQGTPAAVARLHAAIRGADGLIIATPEYNHGVPGGLKNAIDWLSRGAMPHGLYEIPCAILGASDGTFGTTRAQYALRQTLTALNAPTMPAPQVLVGHVDQKFDAAGTLVDEGTRKIIGAWLAAAERWMRRFPRGERA